MSGAPTHLLTRLTGSDVEAWNAWRAENLSARVDLVGVDLFRANLTGANLSGADLSWADLTSANLTSANLTSANLSSAYSTGADLTDADLTDADLTDANLSSAIMTEADLTDADLTDADLSWSNLTDADLTGANLSGAHLSGTVGASRSDICAAVPVGSGTLCSAIRYPDGAIQIWTGLGTFDSIDEYRERVVKMGGPYEAERLAWLAWVETRLAVAS